MKTTLSMFSGLAIATLLLSGCAPDADIEASSEPTEEVVSKALASEALKLGYLLPESGTIDFVGAPMISGVQLAVEEINAAGGVLGNAVELINADEGDGGEPALQEVSRLLESDVQGIIGAARSSATLEVIDGITSAGVVQCSPSNDSLSLATYSDSGYFFRTTNALSLQGAALSDLVSESGYSSVAVALRADEYGIPMYQETESALVRRGITLTYSGGYDPEESTFDWLVDSMIDSGAEAFMVLSFQEGAQIVQGLLDSGVSANQIFAGEGMAGESFADYFESADVIEGMRFVSPSYTTPADFEMRLFEFNPGLTDSLFAPHAYDCVNLMALAASVAGSTSSSAIRDNMIAITYGDNMCMSFAECMEYVEAGQSIAYQSATGAPLEFMEVREGGGDPSHALVDVHVWRSGQYVSVGTLVTRF